MSTTQLLNTDKFGPIYSDPNDPNFTVRFKTVRSRKTIKNNAVDNFATDIIINDLNDIEMCGECLVDTLSVRIRVSGSELSMDRLKAIVSSVASQLPDWSNENVLLGFQPTTVPVNPV